LLLKEGVWAATHGGGGGQRPRRREEEERGLVVEKMREEAGFFQFSDPILSSLRSLMEALFISCEKG
jgi:hypothetical protein